MSYTAEPKQQDTNIKVPLISKIAYGIYSLDLSNPLTLVIYSDSCEELLTQLHALLPDCIV